LPSPPCFWPFCWGVPGAETPASWPLTSAVSSPSGRRGRDFPSSYLVAVLFILFDIEVVFMYPWAVAMGDLGVYGLIGMGVFFLVLTVGLIYEWRVGALEWE